MQSHFQTEITICQVRNTRTHKLIVQKIRLFRITMDGCHKIQTQHNSVEFRHFVNCDLRRTYYRPIKSIRNTFSSSSRCWFKNVFNVEFQLCRICFLFSNSKKLLSDRVFYDDCLQNSKMFE